MTNSRDIQTRSLRLHTLETGPADGEPVVLLHGFPQTHHMWRHQIPVLNERYRLLAPDTRGYGGSEKPRNRVSRAMLARDIVDFLDALEIERAHLVGHDWGGVIASAVALKHPERVERLALIDTLVSVWIPWGIHADPTAHGDPMGGPWDPYAVSGHDPTLRYLSSGSG